MSRACIVALIFLLCGCQSGDLELARQPNGAMLSSALQASVDAFSQPLRGLASSHREQFFLGNSFFNQNWIGGRGSVASRDGLGPLFHARSCSGCHFKDGRGRPPLPGEVPLGLLLRVGTGARNEDRSPTTHPLYGGQLDVLAVPGARPEARVTLTQRARLGRFDDGTPYQLQAPEYRMSEWSHGEPASPWVTSARVAPMVAGSGRLEKVSDETLLRLADPEDHDGDGISGRVNRLAGGRLGRLGWKAEQADLRAQISAAFVGDMGLTTRLHPQEDLSATERAALPEADAGQPEVEDAVLDAVILYVQALAVPARREPERSEVLRGERTFAQLGCSACHVPRLESVGESLFGGQKTVEFFAFTDLLLHDMGSDLGDDRPAFDAEGNEWRTPPLWGLGLLATVNGHRRMLHDGRADGVEAAILWHGGEASGAQRAYRSLPAAERRALVAFVESL